MLAPCALFSSSQSRGGRHRSVAAHLEARLHPQRLETAANARRRAACWCAWTDRPSGKKCVRPFIPFCLYFDWFALAGRRLGFWICNNANAFSRLSRRPIFSRAQSSGCCVVVLTTHTSRVIVPRPSLARRRRPMAAAAAVLKIRESAAIFGCGCERKRQGRARSETMCGRFAPPRPIVLARAPPRHRPCRACPSNQRDETKRAVKSMVPWACQTQSQTNNGLGIDSRVV